MATPITNQATLTYNYGDVSINVSSNVASTMLEGPITVSKKSLEQQYRANDILVYTIVIKNTSPQALAGVTVEDDLGAYLYLEDLLLVPLTYVGPTDIYINDVFNRSITPTHGTAGTPLVFDIGEIAASSTLMLTYKVSVNKYAGLDPVNSRIINTAAVKAVGINIPVTATNTIPVASYALIEIEKVMAPNPVVDGSILTYTFEIRNYGNAPGEQLVLEDKFEVGNIPEDLIITIAGTPYTEADYENGLLTIPGVESSYDFNVGAAVITQGANGIVTITPTVKTVVVKGKI